MTLHTTTFPTPFGDFSVAVDDTGAVVATAFGDTTRLEQRLRRPCAWSKDTRRTAAVREQVLAYCEGTRSRFELPLRADGTAFQQRVWRALQDIPPGETRSYASIAGSLGSSPRAVGAANGANPICLLVPCHRVVAKSGALTGFAFGLPLKQLLLRHELRWSTTADSPRAA